MSTLTPYELPDKEMPRWWTLFEKHGDSLFARVLLAIFAILDSVIIFFPPEIAISALVLAKPKKWLFYTLYTTLFTTIGALITYIIGAFFFETFGNIILPLVGGQEAFETAKEIFKGNLLWGILFVGVTPIPWVPFLLAAGAFKANIIIFILGVILARLIRFGVIAFIVAHLGQRGVFYVTNTLRVMGNTGIVIVVLAIIILAVLGTNYLL